MNLRGPLLYPTAALRYVNEAQEIRSDNTRRAKKYTLNQLQERFPGKRLNEFTPADLVDYLTVDAADARRTWASGTQAQERARLRAFFAWCVEVELLEVDPAASLVRTVKVRPRPVRTHSWLTEEQIQKLFSHLGTLDLDFMYRDSVVFGAGLLMGLRNHEIAGIRWSDLRGGTLVLIGKGNKPATLPVPPELDNIIDGWRQHLEHKHGIKVRPDERVVCRFQVVSDGPLEGPRVRIPMVSTKPMTVPGIVAVVRRRSLEALGFPVRPHDLRRSHAGYLEAQGVSLRDIQSQLRHESVMTTERYLGQNPARWADSVTSAVSGFKIGG